MAFRILSLDGGGVKGAFSAGVLAEIEKMTGKRISDHFDLVTGTSTGGIIALGIGLGLSCHKILRFYENHGPKIFPVTGLHRRLGPVYRMIWPKRSQRRLLEALKAVFKDSRLGNSCCRLLIPSYDGISGRIHIFKTAHREAYRQDYLRSAVDVAMATSAAPTFFPAYSSSNGVCYIDGGVWANCPAMLGVLEATCILKERPEDIDLLSIGTTTEPFYVTKPRRMGGALQWHKGIVDLLLQAQSDSILGQVGIMTGKAPLRIDVSVAPGRFSLNDARTIADLVALGNREARIHCAEFADRFLVEPAEPFIPVFTTTTSDDSVLNE